MNLYDFVKAHMDLFTKNEQGEFVIEPQQLTQFKDELLKLEEFQDVTSLTFSEKTNGDIKIIKLGAYKFVGDTNITQLKLTPVCVGNFRCIRFVCTL